MHYRHLRRAIDKAVAPRHPPVYCALYLLVRETKTDAVKEMGASQTGETRTASATGCGSY